MNKNHLLRRERTIVVGDIHGCFDEFMDLLKLVDWKEKEDHLILVGDLVDRGPKTLEVVDWAMKHDANISLIQGNHEAKHLRYFRHEQKKLHNRNYKNPVNMPEYIQAAYDSLTDNHRWFLKQQGFYIRVPEYNLVVVHGGLLPGVKVADHTPQQIIYTRYLDNDTKKPCPLGPPPDFKQANSTFWTEFWDGPENVAFGHHVLNMENVLELPSARGMVCYALDTGCCFGGKLSAAVWTRGNMTPVYFQVDAREKYFAREG